ncbi:MAG: hypothetical protein ACK55I_17650, partial [bacterium]
MADQIDDHRAGQDQEVVLAIGDVHAVGIGPGEPALAHFGHHAAMTAERVLVIEKIAGSLEIVGPGHIDGELAPEQREQVLADLGHHT